MVENRDMLSIRSNPASVGPMLADWVSLAEIHLV